MTKTDQAKILIVEDDRYAALYIRQTLELFGYDAVEIAVSGEGAIQKAEEMKADVVLMDIVLRGKMDGIEAAGIIREQLGIPVIYLTAYSDDQRVQRAKATNPVGYLLKPFQQSDLQHGLKIALQRS